MTTEYLATPEQLAILHHTRGEHPDDWALTIGQAEREIVLGNVGAR